MTDQELHAIRERVTWAGDPEQYDSHSLADAVGDRRALLAEVDRLRGMLRSMEPLLDSGRVYDAKGTEQPTTLLERVRNVVRCLVAEVGERGRLHAELARVREEAADLWQFQHNERETIVDCCNWGEVSPCPKNPYRSQT